MEAARLPLSRFPFHRPLGKSAAPSPVGEHKDLFGVRLAVARLSPRIAAAVSPRRALVLLALAVMAAIAVRLFAQVEGERGIAPIASNGDFEVSGILVETTGDNAEDARLKGWKEAQKLAWDKLWLETGHSGK